MLSAGRCYYQYGTLYANGIYTSVLTFTNCSINSLAWKLEIALTYLVNHNITSLPSTYFQTTSKQRYLHLRNYKIKLPIPRKPIPKMAHIRKTGCGI
jgi:hypothetical protein